MEYLRKLILFGLFSPLIFWPFDKLLALLEIKKPTQWKWTEYLLVHYSIVGMFILIYFVLRMLKKRKNHQA